MLIIATMENKAGKAGTKRWGLQLGLSDKKSLKKVIFKK